MNQARFRTTAGRGVLAFALLLALVACSGVPMRSLPKLAKLPAQLLEADPGHLRVAVQTDARLAPPPGSTPRLTIQVTPKHVGAFEPVSHSLPLDLVNTAAATHGLGAPGPGRRWLVYSLPPASQADLRQVQATIRQAKAQTGPTRGGSIAVSVEQKGMVPPTDASLAQTRWSTWLQLTPAEGFYEVWSGTPDELRRLAEARR